MRDNFVLYKGDMAEKGGYLHLSTNNKHFIRMSALLRSMGIQNNKFFLALFDKDLMDVDPHNLKDNSLELKMRIVEEATINPWYFVRECSRVNAISSDGRVPFILHRLNLSYMWCVFNNFDTFQTTIRQVGKTTGVLTPTNYLMHLAAAHYNAAFMSKDSGAVQEAVDRMKLLRDFLPPYFISKTSKDTDNKEGLTYGFFDNKFRTFIAQPSNLGAYKIARGLSIPKIIIDEIAYFNNIHITFKSAVAATTMARTQAIEHDLIACLSVATTAGDPSTQEGKYAFNLKNNCMPFYEKLYDCKDREEVTNILKQNSPRKMFYLHYNHKQLGFTDEWLEEQILRSDCTEEEADRDFRAIWRSSTSKGGIDKDLMDVILKNMKDPAHTVMQNNMLFKYYVEEHILNDDRFQNKKFILGMDSGENVGSDSCALFMLDPKTLDTVMTLETSTVNLNVFAKTIFELLKQFPNMLFIPERNSTGAMILDTIIDLMVLIGMDPYKRIYNTVVQDSFDSSKVKTESIIEGADKGKFGFRTTRGTNGRPLLYGAVIKRGLQLGKTKIKDATLIKQLQELVVINGRLDHPKDGHDDLVIAYLLTMFIVLYGNNLDFYGINNSDLINIDAEEFKEAQSKTNKPIINKDEYQEMIRQIGSLENMIKDSTSIYLQNQYSMLLRELKDKLSQYDIDPSVLSKTQMKEDIEFEHGASGGLSLTHFLNII